MPTPLDNAMKSKVRNQCASSVRRPRHSSGRLEHLRRRHVPRGRRPDGQPRGVDAGGDAPVARSAQPVPRRRGDARGAPR
ncbi:uncharacterized protein VDAG_09963 [Verticillium dahliae VdLs.17]|uniref:Uncharacterized protein n=1 Tax=Verticillium dahliae (strain VdLs.17 / ATCC MYA-4575 / FGSC 10137) TaxID=498257 RepID=G2XII1_VERDV|nr:uncharacterized protein VDAG_09963 [Verticillium dahliae VdLs.17]EGY20334.1 hypothetical protein VDAG_09963 [Verticillium dahliae VdLs.17]